MRVEEQKQDETHDERSKTQEMWAYIRFGIVLGLAGGLLIALGLVVLLRRMME